MDRSARNGVWHPGVNSPPYIEKFVMFAPAGPASAKVDYARRLLGLKRTWRDRELIGPAYLNTFDGDHFRFVSRSVGGIVVVPPLAAPPPELDSRSAKYLQHFVFSGGNKLVFCGGVQNLLFLNSLVKWLGYDEGMDQKMGPQVLEKQEAAMLSPFAKGPYALPGDQAWCVSVKRLPLEATSYYEGPGVSCVFSLPAGKGTIYYLGGPYLGQQAAWDELLLEVTGLST